MNSTKVGFWQWLKNNTQTIKSFLFLGSGIVLIFCSIAVAGTCLLNFLLMLPVIVTLSFLVVLYGIYLISEDDC